MKGECSCWVEYPNERHKRPSGKWICVDKYECVRPLKVQIFCNGEIVRATRKTLCRKKEVKGE